MSARKPGVPAAPTPAPAPAPAGADARPSAGANADPRPSAGADPGPGAAGVPARPAGARRARVASPALADSTVSGDSPAPADRWSGTVIEPVPTTADDLAALVLAVPDVVRLHAGRLGEVATYLPGRRVVGIKLADDLIEVHVVVGGRTPVRDTARLIHAAVATLVATPVHVYIEDLALA